MLKKLNLRDLIFFFGGMILLALGIRIISLSNLGLSFSDALFLRISEIFNIPALLSSFIVGVFTIIVASIILKKRPRIECLLISFMVGFFVDFWNLLISDVPVNSVLMNILVFFVGVFILSIGISIYLQPGYPPHPNDLIFAVFSLLFMAKIGIGSIFNTLCLGFFINKGFDIFRKIYNSK